MNGKILDERLLEHAQQLAAPFARFALFVVYGLFGLLKVLDLSPATPLVHHLFEKTLAFTGIPFTLFNTGFGAFEVVLGVCILLPRFTRVILPLFVVHLFTTVLPLIVLPHDVWTTWFVPTLEGQYILKNILIVACMMTIAAGETHTNTHSSTSRIS